MYYSKQFECYMPEAIRIQGRPIYEPVTAPRKGSEYYNEWAEIEALEDAGEIYVDHVTRRATIANRERVSRLNKRKRKNGIAPLKDSVIV